MKKNITSNKKFALEITGYTKKFGKFVAVENASFGVSHGKIHGFIGPNGAGKTTTIKAIIGAYAKSSGTIMVEGFKAGSKKAKQKIGYIPERASFPPGMTCTEYLVGMAQLSGFSWKESSRKAKEILKDLDLWKHRHRNPNDFSSGMKKKILVAQALMTDPTVLVLDEPAANLDPTARREMFKMFKDITRKGHSILISSHILSELQYIIDEVTFISQGKIRFTGGINELKSENGIIMTFPDNDKKTQDFIKKHNFVETTSGWKATTPDGATEMAIVKKAFSQGIRISTVSFLATNLSAAYDRLVQEHGRVSGVEKKKFTAKLLSFLKRKKKGD